MTLADIIECTIDFEGQKLAEKLTQYLLIVSGIACFAAGYATQSMLILLEVFAVGLIVTGLVVIPPWPMYNKNPQPFINQVIIEKKEE